MSRSRLGTAFEAGGFDTSGNTLWINPGVEAAHLGLRDPVCVQVYKTGATALSGEGLASQTKAAGTGYDLAIVTVDRARQRSQIWIAEAVSRLAPGGWLIVDGAKTDGIDSLWKACRGHLHAADSVTKAHGRTFWGQPEGAGFSDWGKIPDEWPAADGFKTAPGVFSATHVDPASAALVGALPASLGKRVADLGAGWGFLTAAILDRSDLEDVVLVENDAIALDAARANVDDPRAVFLWEDVTQWRTGRTFDSIVMNPPFHTGRKPDPALGRAFIASAAANLKQAGHLWMVANRQLPYEETLNAAFQTVESLDAPGAFKILHASRPRDGARKRNKR